MNSQQRRKNKREFKYVIRLSRDTDHFYSGYAQYMHRYQWCEQNVGKKGVTWKIPRIYSDEWYFAREEDAVMFSLIWS